MTADDNVAQSARLRLQLERTYDELAGRRASEPDGQSTAQALHEAEQRVAALLDDEQLRQHKRGLEGERDAAFALIKDLASSDPLLLRNLVDLGEDIRWYRLTELLLDVPEGQP